MIGFGGHRGDHLGREGALGRKAHDDVGTAHGVGQGARLGRHGVGRLPLVHAGRAALPDHALGVAQHDVAVRHAHGLDQLGAGDAGRAGAVDHQLACLERAAGQVQRVDQAGGGDDRRAVLVVVEHRDAHQLAQALLDDEALGRLDVLEVDAAEGRAEQAHAVDELVDVGGVDLEVDAVDVGEALEQDGLALHHRLGGEGAEIAEAKDRGAVGDHRHEIAPGGVVVGGVGILLDREARGGDAGRVGQRQVAGGGQRLGRDDLDLAGAAAGMQRQGLLGRDAIAGHRLLDALQTLLVAAHACLPASCDHLVRHLTGDVQARARHLGLGNRAHHLNAGRVRMGHP